MNTANQLQKQFIFSFILLSSRLGLSIHPFQVLVLRQAPFRYYLYGHQRRLFRALPSSCGYVGGITLFFLQEIFTTVMTRQTAWIKKSARRHHHSICLEHRLETSLRGLCRQHVPNTTDISGVRIQNLSLRCYSAILQYALSKSHTSLKRTSSKSGLFLPSTQRRFSRHSCPFSQDQNVSGQGNLAHFGVRHDAVWWLGAEVCRRFGFGA